MMSLSHTTGHAVRALTCLASCSNPPASIKDLAECSGVPQAYLAKIVKKLNNAGIIKSKRGNQGGIWLARPAKLISLLEISTALEGEEFLGSCLFGLDPCSDHEDCPTHRFWIKHCELVRRELERIKLSDMLASHKERDLNQMSDV